MWAPPSENPPAGRVPADRVTPTSARAADADGGPFEEAPLGRGAALGAPSRHAGAGGGRRGPAVAARRTSAHLRQRKTETTLVTKSARRASQIAPRPVRIPCAYMVGARWLCLRAREISLLARFSLRCLKYRPRLLRAAESARCRLGCATSGRKRAGAGGLATARARCVRARRDGEGRFESPSGSAAKRRGTRRGRAGRDRNAVVRGRGGGRRARAAARLGPGHAASLAPARRQRVACWALLRTHERCAGRHELPEPTRWCGRGRRGCRGSCACSACERRCLADR